MEKIHPNIRKIYLISFLMGMQFWIGVIIPFFMDWGKISFFEIMILQFLFLMVMLLLEIPTGVVADYIGRKVSLISAILCAGFGIVLYASKPDFTIFIIAEIMWALGAALCSGADEALIYDSLKEVKQESKSKKVLGRYRGAFLIGLVIAGPIGSLIASSIGLRWVMFSTGIPFLTALIIACYLKEPKRDDSSPTYWKILIGGIKFFWHNTILQRLTLEGVVAHAFCFSIVWTQQVLYKELGISIIYFGFLASLALLCEGIVADNFGKLEKILGNKMRYIFISSFLPAIAFILIGIFHSIYLAIVCIVIIEAFGISRIVLINNYMQKHIESHNRATVSSITMMCKSLFGACMHLLVGRMVEWSLKYCFLIIGGALGIFSLIPKIKKEHLID